jgi:hypothetical protein
VSTQTADTDTHHHLAAICQHDGGYRAECSCGWLPGPVTTAHSLLQQWQDHRAED